ncbi:hypothetical protein [Pseudarthrobacter sp. GA104]|uniref:hypothetical protein n=1 Tax=Pseudarthrobacter sp. GA104 TaxID=2676311 RepID=UPI0012F92223|nr:hypothetical protein [Pseudarthrobacter sp. GA104]MUU73534.1 hypothetical protein [Pseudarthrobacter sp. GA104]
MGVRGFLVFALPLWTQLFGCEQGREHGAAAPDTKAQALADREAAKLAKKNARKVTQTPQAEDDEEDLLPSAGVKICRWSHPGSPGSAEPGFPAAE